MSVCRLSMEASLVRRMSVAEKRVKTSSVDSGSCQNYDNHERSPSQVFELLTPVQ